MKDKRRKDNKVSSIQSLIEKRNRELNNEEHLSNHDANHKDKNEISTDDAQLYKINKPKETSKQQDQNQSIDEDNFNNQSNESEQLEQNEAIEQSNETSDEDAQSVESTKRMIVTDSPLILVKTHISYLLKIELKSSMTIVKEKTCQEYTI